ncbi:MmcQ/YjbR family DNA-binding protein [Deinococcus peraridilitoris]|uniref:MmcQ/YjbR family DNA-binding protein n=1 Tax=Deinococcus peraridilitoris (strain DSM 19664 / LMG 22246 / CIP 109416 / KR-200) TaxID=937777 RepID=L0A7J1_DEIPD|nr:MmcQ/YjbR family DNA-binding protein [Deinococcus peraridilitoris]AFZ69025.1 hypothetical protein Deipe_3597 [Deinococcus peraridilitoris DSM 19664]
MKLVSELRSMCAAFPGSRETFPFDHQNLVFKVGGEDRDTHNLAGIWKMYAMVNITEDPLRLLVKCDRVRSAALREQFPAIHPAAYFGGHWIFLPLDGTLPGGLVEELLRTSYQVVVTKSLPGRIRERLSAC